jgi:hypothetical protein
MADVFRTSSVGRYRHGGTPTQMCFENNDGGGNLLALLRAYQRSQYRLRRVEKFSRPSTRRRGSAIARQFTTPGREGALYWVGAPPANHNKQSNRTDRRQ